MNAEDYAKIAETTPDEGDYCTGDDGGSYWETNAEKTKFEIARRIRAAAPAWTSERPTVSGFYWVYEPRLKRPPTLSELNCECVSAPWRVVIIGCDDVMLPGDFDPASLWCGPITPPEVPSDGYSQ